MNAKGEKWSIERLVRIQLGKAIRPTAINGGTDGLIALTAARNAWLLTGKPLEGVWLDADNTIKRHIQLVQDHQNFNGTLSSNFFGAGGDMKDFDKHLASSGALLQFLMVALSDEQLKEDWVRRAIEATVKDMQLHRKAMVRCDSLYGATNALSIYLDRVLDAGNIVGF